MRLIQRRSRAAAGAIVFGGCALMFAWAGDYYAAIGFAAAASACAEAWGLFASGYVWAAASGEAATTLPT